MISKFNVENFKSLANVTIPLSPIHVLIGQNDTGKSSIFESIRACIQLHARLKTSISKTRAAILADTMPLLREIIPGDWEGSELVWHKAGIKTVTFRMSIDGGSSGLSGNFNCTMNFDENNKIEIEPNAIQTDLRINYLNFRPKSMSLPSMLNAVPKHTLEEDGFGLPTLLDEIKDYDISRFVDIQDHFCKYFPQFQRIRLETAKSWTRDHQERHAVDKYAGRIGKQVWLVKDDGEVRLQQASDGAVLLLGFLALLHSPNPPDVFLVEEPENGIHPKRLGEIIKLLRTFVQEKKNSPQIIMTTHSPYLLSEFQPEEVTLMRRQPDGSAKAFPLRDAPHIRERMGNEFYLGELWYNLDEEELLK